jgi:hypothetical protein
MPGEESRSGYSGGRLEDFCLLLLPFGDFDLLRLLRSLPLTTFGDLDFVALDRTVGDLDRDGDLTFGEFGDFEGVRDFGSDPDFDFDPDSDFFPDFDLFFPAGDLDRVGEPDLELPGDLDGESMTDVDADGSGDAFGLELEVDFFADFLRFGEDCRLGDLFGLGDFLGFGDCLGGRFGLSLGLLAADFFEPLFFEALLAFLFSATPLPPSLFSRLTFLDFKFVLLLPSESLLFFLLLFSPLLRLLPGREPSVPGLDCIDRAGLVAPEAISIGFAEEFSAPGLAGSPNPMRKSIGFSFSGKEFSFSGNDILVGELIG